MKRIDSVWLVFENCEDVRIDAKYIGMFHVGDIRREITRVAINAICDRYVANEVAMEIFSEADGPYTVFGEYSRGDGIDTVFRRIMAWDDITEIVIEYDDGTDETFLVNYDEGLDEGKLGAANILQESKLSVAGNLYVVISTEGADINKAFPDDVINDKESVAIMKRVYGALE